MISQFEDKSIVLVMNDNVKEEKKEEWVSYIRSIIGCKEKAIPEADMLIGGLAAGIGNSAHISYSTKSNCLESKSYLKVNEKIESHLKSLWFLGGSIASCRKESSSNYIDNLSVAPTTSKRLCALPLLYDSGWFVLYESSPVSSNDITFFVEQLESFIKSNIYLRPNDLREVCSILDGQFSLVVFDIENTNLVFVADVDSNSTDSEETNNDVRIIQLDNQEGFIISAGINEKTNRSEFSLLDGIKGAKYLGPIKRNSLYVINREKKNIETVRFNNHLIGSH
jgi:hypothetical protein